MHALPVAGRADTGLGTDSYSVGRRDCDIDPCQIRTERFCPFRIVEYASWQEGWTPLLGLPRLFPLTENFDELLFAAGDEIAAQGAILRLAEPLAHGLERRQHF